MATSGYVSEIQPAAQPQGTGVTVTPGQPDASSTPPTAPQFLAEIQTTVVTPTVVTPTGQTTTSDQATAITTQKPTAGSQGQSTAQAQPAQTQYVTAEIQGSPTQSGNAQSTPQYIVVTVTGKTKMNITFQNSHWHQHKTIRQVRKHFLIVFIVFYISKVYM